MGVGPDIWGAGGSDPAPDPGPVGQRGGVCNGSGAAACDVPGGRLEAFDRPGESRVGETPPQRAGAFAGAGGEAHAGGAGMDRSISQILGGKSGSVRKLFGQTTKTGNKT